MKGAGQRTEVSVENIPDLESGGRRKALQAGGALALGGLAGGCATATGILPVVPPAAKVVQDTSQVSVTPAAPGAVMPREAEDKPTFVAQSRDPADYSRADNLFWNDVLMEHAQFFQMLMWGPELQAERGQAEDFERIFAEMLRQSGAVTRENYVAFNRRTIDQVLRFADWKKTMEQRQASGKMHSLVFPLFFTHTAREADRFATRLNQYNHGSIELDRAEVVDFWSKTMGEHSGFIVQLLDPTELLLINQARKLEESFLRKGFRDVGGDDVMKAAHEVLDFKTVGEKGIRNGRIRSVIHPSLASHVRREAVRFIDELRRT
jgi:hypothetical protein